MSKLISTIEYQFEELPDFWDGEFRSGSHNGVAEISYAFNGEWFVSGISLDCHNGKFGAEAKGKLIPVSQAYQGPLYHGLADALQHFSSGYIQDKVWDAINGDTDTRPRLALVSSRQMEAV